MNQETAGETGGARPGGGWAAPAPEGLHLQHRHRGGGAHFLNPLKELEVGGGGVELRAGGPGGRCEEWYLAVTEGSW